MRSEGRNMNFCSSSDVQVCCFGAGSEDGLFFKLRVSRDMIIDNEGLWALISTTNVINILTFESRKQQTFSRNLKYEI